MMRPTNATDGFSVAPTMLWISLGLIVAGLSLSTWADVVRGNVLFVVLDAANYVFLIGILALYLRGRMSLQVTFGAVVYSSSVNFLVNMVSNVVTGTPHYAADTLYSLINILIFTTVAGFVLHKRAFWYMGVAMVLMAVVASLYQRDPFLLDVIPVLTLSLGGVVWVLYFYRDQLERLVNELDTSHRRTQQALNDLSVVQARVMEQDGMLRQYVNPSILEAVRLGRVGERFLKDHLRVEATVAFVDICEFTRLTETLPPEPVAKLLNRYFDEIALGTLQFGGTIDKFIGDAALLVFRDDDHLRRAGLALKAIFARIEHLEGAPLWESEPYPGVSAGMHTGEVISGTFGSLTLRRWDYTVMGDVVNTAARLEGFSEKGQILITNSTKLLLDPEFPARKVGVKAMKHKAVSTLVWDLGLTTPES